MKKLSKFAIFCLVFIIHRLIYLASPEYRELCYTFCYYLGMVFGYIIIIFFP